MANFHPGIESIGDIEEKIDEYGDAVGFRADAAAIVHTSALEAVKRNPLRLRPGLFLAMLSRHDGMKYAKTLIDQASIRSLPMDQEHAFSELPLFLTCRDRVDSQVVGGIIAEPGLTVSDELGNPIVENAVLIEGWSAKGSNSELSDLYDSVIPVAREIYGDEVAIGSVEALVQPRTVASGVFARARTIMSIGEPTSDDGIPEVVASFYQDITAPQKIQVNGMTPRPFYGVLMTNPHIA